MCVRWPLRKVSLWKTGSIASHILNLAKMSGQVDVPSALLGGNSPLYSLDTKLDGPHSRSERWRGNRSLLLLLGIEPRFRGRLVLNLVFIRSEQCWALRYRSDIEPKTCCDVRKVLLGLLAPRKFTLRSCVGGV
jgi:hypothetical protein